MHYLDRRLAKLEDVEREEAEVGVRHTRSVESGEVPRVPRERPRRAEHVRLSETMRRLAGRSLSIWLFQ